MEPKKRRKTVDFLLETKANAGVNHAINKLNAVHNTKRLGQGDSPASFGVCYPRERDD
jgi:hypothetical protein